MSNKTLKIGLLGFGTVGSGTYRMLTANEEFITSTANVKIEVAKILVRDKNKKRDLEVPAELLTENPDDILKDPSIHVVVEVLGGVHPAYEYMMEAIQNKKHVVTANKAVIAALGEELTTASLQNKVMLRYEASVGGGIPILNAISTSLQANLFTELVGIVNGTTNYILTQMTENGLSYDSALKEAQMKGFAEGDPTDDVEGIDAANKLAILISTAFGVRINPKDIPRQGITNVTSEDIEYAKQNGYRIKLLATAKRYRSTLECHVQPAMVPMTHPLATVNNEFNAIFVKGNAVDDVMLYGKGAGSMPTGSAVVGDLVEIGRAFATNTTEFAAPTAVNNNKCLVFDGEGQNMYYVNMLAEDITGGLGMIAAALGRHGISIGSFSQRSKGHQTGRVVPLVYIFHETTRECLDEALEEIRSFSCVKEIRSVMNVAALD